MTKSPQSPSPSQPPPSSEHFKGKEPLHHVAEVQAKNLVSSTEFHGIEMPGHLAAGMDAARESVIIATSSWMLLTAINTPPTKILLLLIAQMLGWVLWKTGRSVWLGWSRLERLHLLMKEEQWEIEHNRAQEREELMELYQSKGFEGQLLEDVTEVLMADKDRLLKVMLEEELGLSLEEYEHPLSQGLGAFLGSLASSLLCLISAFLFSSIGLFITGFTIIGASGIITAKYQKNNTIPAVIWNLSIATLAVGTTYFFLQYLTTKIN